MGAGADDDAVDRLQAEVDQLKEALATRDLIGQAKGILMERHEIDAQEAFARLVRISQATNTKVRDVAVVVATGQLGVVRKGSRRTPSTTVG